MLPSKESRYASIRVIVRTEQEIFLHGAENVPARSGLALPSVDKGATHYGQRGSLLNGSMLFSVRKYAVC